MKAMANEAKEGPRLFTWKPTDPDWKKKLFSKRYQIRLWCEAEGCPHPIHEEKDKSIGVYEFDADREWVTRVAPYARFIVGMLKTVAPIAAPAVNTIL